MFNAGPRFSRVDLLRVRRLVRHVLGTSVGLSGFGFEADFPREWGSPTILSLG